MKTRFIFFGDLLLLLVLAGTGCKGVQTNPAPAQSASAPVIWQQSVRDAIPLMGHRNWLLVTDMAFPKQNAAGVHYINTGEKLLPVLRQVLTQLQSAGHVRPVIYQDRELAYLTEQLSPGINSFRDSVKTLLHGLPVQAILHDSVFTKIDAASRLFDVWVLKTTEQMPYTSVFMQLNCGYWTDSNENALRKMMQQR